MSHNISSWKDLEKEKVVCGVPQGSVLGLLVFLLYVNDIQTSFKKFDFFLFADDTTCFLQIKWDANCESDNCYKPNWKTAYKPAFRCTKSTKLANFHYRFLHRILPTNCFLTRIGLKNNSICTFCGDFPEELCHLFWYCKNTLIWGII